MASGESLETQVETALTHLLDVNPEAALKAVGRATRSKAVRAISDPHPRAPDALAAGIRITSDVYRSVEIEFRETRDLVLQSLGRKYGANTVSRMANEARAVFRTMRRDSTLSEAQRAITTLVVAVSCDNKDCAETSDLQASSKLLPLWGGWTTLLSAQEAAKLLDVTATEFCYPSLSEFSAVTFELPVQPSQNGAK